jgi:hypothetical protein
LCGRQISWEILCKDEQITLVSQSIYEITVQTIEDLQYKGQNGVMNIGCTFIITVSWGEAALPEREFCSCRQQ